MHVVGNAGAGGAAGVGADVESLRLQLFTENSYRALGRAHQVGGLDIVERIELAAMCCRRHHDVAGVIRKLVQHHHCTLRPPDHEICVRVVGVLEDAAEQAACLRLAGDVLHAPGRPQSLH